MTGETTAPPAIDLPEPSELMAEFRAALAEGRLTIQRCSRCSTAWLPQREHCPNCLSPDWERETASGRASVVSWVVYHRAYHPAFADRVPYNVVVVELEEGPRMVSNVVGITEAEGLRIGTALRVVFEREGDVPVARFEVAS
jgi:uncharacterized OB-fold protein